MFHSQVSSDFLSGFQGLRPELDCGEGVRYLASGLRTDYIATAPSMGYLVTQAFMCTEAVYVRSERTRGAGVWFPTCWHPMENPSRTRPVYHMITACGMRVLRSICNIPIISLFAMANPSHTSMQRVLDIYSEDSIKASLLLILSTPNSVGRHLPYLHLFFLSITCRYVGILTRASARFSRSLQVLSPFLRRPGVPLSRPQRKKTLGDPRGSQDTPAANWRERAPVRTDVPN